jgi:hypothetical protein
MGAIGGVWNNRAGTLGEKVKGGATRGAIGAGTGAVKGAIIGAATGAVLGQMKDNNIMVKETDTHKQTNTKLTAMLGALTGAGVLGFQGAKKTFADTKDKRIAAVGGAVSAAIGAGVGAGLGALTGRMSGKYQDKRDEKLDRKRVKEATWIEQYFEKQAQTPAPAFKFKKRHAVLGGVGLAGLAGTGYVMNKIFSPSKSETN